MLSQEQNQRLTRVGQGTPKGATRKGKYEAKTVKCK